MKRMTPLRHDILLLLDEHRLLTVPALIEKLKLDHEQLHKTTVYRALEFLMATGKVCRHNISGNELAFELREHHHDHLICTHCGLLQTVECIVHPPKKVGDFTVQHHHLTLYGVCGQCLEEQTTLEQKKHQVFTFPKAA